MQKVSEVHESDSSACSLSIRVGVLQVFPSKTRALPKSSTTAQKLAEVHEIVGEPMPPASGSAKMGAPQLTPSYVTTLPNLSMAAQKLDVGQDTDVGSACAASATEPVDHGEDEPADTLGARRACVLGVEAVLAATAWVFRPAAPRSAATAVNNVATGCLMSSHPQILR